MAVAGWSSLVARWAHNPKVDGSNPSPATKLSFKIPNSISNVKSGSFDGSLILFYPCFSVDAQALIGPDSTRLPAFCPCSPPQSNRLRNIVSCRPHTVSYVCGCVPGGSHIGLLDLLPFPRPTKEQARKLYDVSELCAFPTEGVDEPGLRSQGSLGRQYGRQKDSS